MAVAGDELVDVLGEDAVPALATVLFSAVASVLPLGEIINPNKPIISRNAKAMPPHPKQLKQENPVFLAVEACAQAFLACCIFDIVGLSIMCVSEINERINMRLLFYYTLGDNQKKYYLLRY
ncbi:hypothetical protein [Rothia sp. (in: high G+C Gram-positive bacteria)]|uniref:hypothetical protein n=1 Tax=Rothia sp. (in: high G+C Gram-positive bacteria) TaxID=1885016 RepID=UPI0032179AB6